MQKAAMILLVVLLTATTAGAADSPISEGAKIVGGGLSFSVYSGDLYRYQPDFAMTISPAYDVFISDGTFVGSIIDVTYEGGGSGFATVGLGLEVGYYFGADKSVARGAKGLTYPYLSAFGLVRAAGSSYSGAAKGFGLGVQGGVVPMLSNTVGLDVGARIQYDRIEGINGLMFHVGAGIKAFIWD